MRIAARLFASVAFLAAPAFAQTITDAHYAGPTTRYAHGVLGDTIEHHTLVVTVSDGRQLSAHWEALIVFEDTAPRLADMDGDGAPEVIVVESHEREGARLAIWGLREGALRQVAKTPFIGTRFRWLAPVGAADFDGDGAMEVAYVDRPHLAKTLLVWRFGEDGLTKVATARGITNHRIGEDYISGGVRDCGQGPEMIVADTGWSRILAARLTGGKIAVRDVAPFAGRESFAPVLACEQ